MYDRDQTLQTIRRAYDRDPTIRSRVVLLIAIVLLPLIGLFGWLATDYAKVQRRVIEVQRVDVVNNLTALVDREVAGIRGALMGLATSDELISSNFTEFSRQAKIVATQPNFYAIRAFGTDGQVLFSTTGDSGLDPAVNRYADSVQRIFGGQLAVSDVKLDPQSNIQFVSICVPVYRDDRIIYGLAADVRPERMLGLFNEAGIKHDWVAAIIDRTGHFVGRSLSPQEYIGKLARPEVGTIARGMEMNGEFANVTLEGVDVANSFQRSMLTGWTSVVAVPQELLTEPFRNSMQLVTVGVAIISLFSLALASLMAARISEPIRRLSGAATALVEGRALPDTPHRIAELKEVRTAFEHAVAKSAHLAAIVASSGDAIISTNLDGNVRSWNEGAEKLFGFSAKEIIGQSKRRIVPASLYAEFETQMAQIRLGHNLRAETVRRNKAGKDIDVSLEIAPIRGPDGSIDAMSSIIHDITQRKQAEKHQRFMMREISHRSKNLLAIVQSMARQTARSAASIGQFETQYMKRLQGLAASHDLLVNENWTGVSLEDLILRQVVTFIETKTDNLTVSGPKVIISAKAAQALGLALHELGTNSLKYGALSTPNGNVGVEWSYQQTGDEPRALKLQWRETGGPPVTAPVTKGFGHFVMDRMIAQTLDAGVSIQFLPEGLIWNLLVPVASLETDPSELEFQRQFVLS